MPKLPVPAAPQAPQQFDLQQYLPLFLQMIQGMGQQQSQFSPYQGSFLNMLQALAGQDYQRNNWMLNRAQDMYGQGRSEDDYLMNLYGDVLGIDFNSSPGATQRQWIPEGPGGYYDTGTPTPPINGPGNTPAPDNMHSGPAPGASGDVTEKMMMPTESDQHSGGGMGVPPAGPSGPAGPPSGGGGPGTYHPYGPGEGGGHWLESTGPGSYSWQKKPGGFDPNNPTTWGLIAPQASQMAADRDRQIKSLDSYGIRGGEVDRAKAAAGQQYFGGVSGLKQQLMNDALQYIKGSSAQKMFGVSAGENSGAAGQGFNGLNSYLSSLQGNQAGAYGGLMGQMMNFNQGANGLNAQNYWNTMNYNQNIDAQHRSFWQQLLGSAGSLFGGAAKPWFL